VSDQLKEIHQALNENRKEFRVITDNRNLVAQEFLMFENSGTDDLEDVVDKQFSLARFTMKLPVLDAVEYTELIEHVEEKFNETFGDAAKITVTGIVAILMRTITAMSSSMVKSYLIAFVVIAILMVFVVRNFRLGLLSMIPNLLPIIITLGMMGWCGLSLDAFTLLIGSIAIGLVVDDTIHFMHNFTKYYEQSGDPRDAVHQTLQTTGRAVLFTSLILSSGFFIFMFASMSNLFNFGFLTGFTILTALLAEFTLTPALMVLIVKKGKPQSIGEK
jgi:predicted RND superfamily exporter protein